VRKEEERKRRSFDATAIPLMDALYRTALYLCRNPDDAADVLQETYLRAYRSWHQFAPGTNCKAWLLTILHNAFRNRLRSQRAAPALVEFDEPVVWGEIAPEARNRADDPAELVAFQSMDEEVQAALENLPDEFREVVVLVDLEELTYEEASAVVGRPIGTVRSRLSRGRHMLHQALQAYARAQGLLRSK
jgi:RNA polymerase sigma-70 factor (ECF subfamily)